MIRKILRYVVTFQLLGWIVLWLSYVIGGVMRGDDLVEAIVLSTSFTSVQAFCIYLNYFWLIPTFFEKKRYWVYVVLFVLTPLLAIVVHTSITDYYRGNELLANIHFEYVFRAPYLSLFMITTSFFRFGENWMKALQYQQELENSKLRSELNFLKAQIQPHFLFNTLNNIYSYAYMKHPGTTDMIENLSNILRYIVYDGGKEKVELSKEIDIIKKVIALYSVKNTEQENIFLDVSGVEGDSEVMPLILVSLVENAFKHGDLLENEKGYLKIKITVTKNRLLKFSLENTFDIKTALKTEEKIGNRNIIRQLNLGYKDKYQFNSEFVGNVFYQYLTLKIV